MFKQRNVVLLFVFAFLLSLFAACGDSGSSGDANSGNLTVWAMGAEGDNLKALADDFTKANPNIHVTVQAIPWSDAHSKLLTAVAGGQTPDVTLMGTTWMPEFAKMGALDTPPSDIDQNSFFPSTWSTTVYNGTSYGVPWYVDTRVLFYRTDIAQKAGITHAPQTWDELLADAKAMQQKGGAKYGINLGAKDWQELVPFIWQGGGDVYKDGKFTLNTPQTVQALSYYQSFFKQGLTPSSAPQNFDGIQAFVQGTHPMFISGSWNISAINQKSNGKLDGKWAVATLPKQNSMTSFVGGGDLAVFKNSSNKAAAWKFVKYLSQPDVQQKWYTIMQDMPAAKAAWDSGTLSTDKNMIVFRNQLNDAKAPPAIVKWQEVADSIDTNMEQVMLGKATPEQAAQSMQQNAESIGTGD
ncbi:sugar ABC transporter substrate-binding protein [Ktedonospora formicarum]|uniref:Sugar ABC transporter substrate-binding protein n=1 Tax=Ktedonospora formicarum TaxID=2778364 RepID=A0A8J3ID25_9CHLR|nr:sugar ABC transporter substrate-binding protein [Ktedonospora formicarum]GHO50970.1 sugar ABC transporter substrate-binding protein [Ktedonospora formicarum]